MSNSPLAFADSLRIGTVDFVSPDEIKVMLDIEAPESLAINTGSPRPFPRINGYVLVPSDEGYLVGQVEWITVERSQYARRKAMQDSDLVDLPYPLRKLSLNPLGTLSTSGKNNEGEQQFRFRRGVETFPSVGDQVLLPTGNQLKSIIESGDNRRVMIGTSPLAEGAEVKVDPNRLFGRHLAVLGNTGSGKSCSVAGLIRWSLEAAQEDCLIEAQPNARFIVLDPNGEYRRAFQDSEKARIFSVETKQGDELNQLQVPLWFWNSAEWCAFTQASSKTQRPLLRRGLREIRGGKASNSAATEEEKLLALRRYFSSKLVKLKNDIRQDAIKTESTKFGFYLAAVAGDIAEKVSQFGSLSSELTTIKSRFENLCRSTHTEFTDKSTGERVEYFKAFQEKGVSEVITEIEKFLNMIGGVTYQEGPDEDSPLEFSGPSFADHVQQLGIEENVSQFVDLLVMRIRTLLSDTRMKSIVGPSETTLESWLTDYIGANRASNGTVTVIDLSLVPSEVVHIITAVIARMTFEGLQRYRRGHEEHKTLPTVLVMEEAHTFIRRYKEDSEHQDAATACCQLFEKIAREGRKFGLGLVLSSQRPSELSPTVLSQCNTFLLHRISNDRDQELVHKLVPDALKGLLRDLPSLPSQNAILLGWASELPVLVRMNDLPKNQQPQSDDPDFWEVWTGLEKNADGTDTVVERSINWGQIASDWQQKGAHSQPDQPSPRPSSEPATEADDDVPF